MPGFSDDTNFWAATVGLAGIFLVPIAIIVLRIRRHRRTPRRSEGLDIIYASLGWAFVMLGYTLIAIDYGSSTQALGLLIPTTVIAFLLPMGVYRRYRWQKYKFPQDLPSAQRKRAREQGVLPPRSKSR